jgi:hypothetical protein
MGIALGIEDHVDIGIFARIHFIAAAADDHEDAIGSGAVVQPVAILDPCGPCNDIAGADHDLSRILDQHCLACQHDQQLVLLPVPVSLRGVGIGLQHDMAGPQMSQPRHRSQPAVPAPLHLGIVGGRVTRRFGLGDGIEIELGHRCALLLADTA